LSDLLRRGRLGSARRDFVKFTSSIKSDKKLLKPVININKAHMVMLIEREIIESAEGTAILDALNKLKEGLRLKSSLEDVHMTVEEAVIKTVGPEIGGNLNLAKSRNDQVSTAVRMALREELIKLSMTTIELQESLINLSKKHLETLIPGYTHLQPAQPITFAHYLLSYFDAFERDLKRIGETYGRVNLCPMGAGALATTSFPVSRERITELLGFSGILENSVDAVSSRDFLLESLAVLSVMAVDVSRFVEDMIIWSSSEFGILELSDEFASTSSIMPQKKNPDVLEVIRARMSHILGDFFASAMGMKALPSSYNLDLQEVTPKLWDALETMEDSLGMLSKIIPHLRVNRDVFDKPSLSFLTSTELANMLVRKYGVPFRTAHRIVGSLVKVLMEKGESLLSATPELLSRVAHETARIQLRVKTEDIRLSTDPLNFVESHRVRGGPAKTEVERMLKEREKSLSLLKDGVLKEKERLADAEKRLELVVKSRLEAKGLRKI